MSAVSLAASSVLESAVGGLHRASADLNRAGAEVARGAVQAMDGASGSSSSTTDTVAFSDVAQRIAAENSVQGGLLDASSAGLIYTANAQVVNTAQQTEQSLFNIIA